jgi:hypothetical protein
VFRTLCLAKNLSAENGLILEPDIFILRTKMDILFRIRILIKTAFKDCRYLVLENLALRQQLVVVKRT